MITKEQKTTLKLAILAWAKAIAEETEENKSTRNERTEQHFEKLKEKRDE